ncbi:FAD-binding protein [Fodinisporobacter ferrooxydans]|uniref:D-lactate dehydrogenase (cytochrome) n=1 Tax=Fodinisporobacter ferrooxydans TaxID=2901836 RepID=A0ABY4CQ53_9BACL|nr:FAD-binding protein [Alicyclobacillaceae bacterium MYW30-H2]
MELAQELLEIITDPSRISTNLTIREQHGQDVSYHLPKLPDVVVYPQDKQEVSKILQFANERAIPVIPFGVGSSLEGHIIPAQGGITIDMTLMNQIIEIRPEDFLVKAQPGVTRNQLNKALQAYGLFFPVDPGADATIGGMAATNASGTNAVRYGVMRDQVKGLEVVLADGTVIHTGGMSMKSSAGYNLTGLFVGSEGTLGVFTEITLKVYGIPETTIAARAVFPDIGTATQAATAIISSGVAIGKVELVDDFTIDAVNQYKGTAYEPLPTLFLEFSGHKASVDEESSLVKEILQSEGCVNIQFEKDSKARAQLWEARHQVAMAILAKAPGKRLMSTDVCVPLSQLPGALVQARQILSSYQLVAGLLGHVGDGNYHASILIDPNDMHEVENAEIAHEEIVRYALGCGGTCTGEHGVGMGKKQYLSEEHGAEAVAVMKLIKGSLDPKRILNPGKILS